MQKTILAFCLVCSVGNPCAQDLTVTSSAELATAFNYARAGDRIVLADGSYEVFKLKTAHAGSAGKPITVIAQTPGGALIHATGIEAFSILHPYWIIDGLTFKGQADSDHALHIVGNADHTVIRNNTLQDFNAQIKVNGEDGLFPDSGLIENNDLFNNYPRPTGLPVASIDIVGGRDWIVRDNYIADFGKLEADQTSYGLFLKGNSQRGIVENNLIICSRHNRGGIRIGMSFGGGGSGAAACEANDCSVEHTEGQMRNNVVLNCSDVGIYLNKAKDSIILNNTLLLTAGIDVRYPVSSALISDNLLSGGVRSRDSGNITVRRNLAFGTSLGMWLPGLRQMLESYTADLKILQDFSDSLLAWLENSALGLGLQNTRQCFPALDGFDLSPNPEQCGAFWLDPGRPSVTATDFWGTPRSPGQNVMGAIDFYRSNCQLINRIMHKAPPLPADCLR